ncbi:hypothetical protein D3C77_809230 [compost metagenome]
MKDIADKGKPFAPLSPIGSTIVIRWAEYKVIDIKQTIVPSDTGNVRLSETVVKLEKIK